MSHGKKNRDEVATEDGGSANADAQASTNRKARKSAEAKPDATGPANAGAGSDSPRLDEVSANAPLLAPDEEAVRRKRAAPGAEEPEAPKPRRISELNDEEGDDFGPTLAAWLAAYRARQGDGDTAAASAPVKREPEPEPEPIQLQETPPQDHPSGNEEYRDMPRPPEQRYDYSGPNPRRAPQPDDPIVPEGPEHVFAPPGTAGRAYWDDDAPSPSEDVLSTMPPGWIAPHHSHPAPRRRGRGSRFLAVTSIVLLLTGVAGVALVAAARNNGVELDLSRIASVFETVQADVAVPASSGASLAPSTVTIERQATVQPRTDVSTSQTAPAATTRIEVVPTRIVRTTPAADTSQPVSPSSTIGRSTVLMPAERAAPTADQSVRSTGTLRQPQGAQPPVDRQTPTPAVAEQPPTLDEPPAMTTESAAMAYPEQTASVSQPAEQPVRVASLQPPTLALTPRREGLTNQSRRQLNQEGVSVKLLDQFVERAGQLLSQGDVVAARMLYEQAARKGHVAAAVGAGSTYDPVYLSKLGVHGIEPEPDKAIRWYEAAHQAGDAAVIEKIEALRLSLRN